MAMFSARPALAETAEQMIIKIIVQIAIFSRMHLMIEIPRCLPFVSEAMPNTRTYFSELTKAATASICGLFKLCATGLMMAEVSGLAGI